MKKRFSAIRRGFIVALALGSGAFLATARADAPKEIVLKREKTMSEMGHHMVAIKDFLKEDKGSAADVARRAKEISAIVAKIPSMFPDGTDMNGAADSKYKARPEIWLDPEGFEKAAKQLADESEALAIAAAGGDKAAIMAAFQNLGKNGCENCHQNFRMKVN